MGPFGIGGPDLIGSGPGLHSGVLGADRLGVAGFESVATLVWEPSGLGSFDALPIALGSRTASGHAFQGLDQTLPLARATFPGDRAGWFCYLSQKEGGFSNTERTKHLNMAKCEERWIPQQFKIRHGTAWMEQTLESMDFQSCKQGWNAMISLF
jgi:hypothetical protein